MTEPWYRSRQFWEIAVAVVPFGWLLPLCRMARATPWCGVRVVSRHPMRPRHARHHRFGLGAGIREWMAACRGQALIR